jgi:hypothetical protein
MDKYVKLVEDCNEEVQEGFVLSKDKHDKLIKHAHKEFGKGYSISDQGELMYYGDPVVGKQKEALMKSKYGKAYKDLEKKIGQYIKGGDKELRARSMKKAQLGEAYSLKDRVAKQGAVADLGNKLWFKKTSMTPKGMDFYVYYLDSLKNGNAKVMFFIDEGQATVKGVTKTVNKSDLSAFQEISPSDLPKGVQKGASKKGLMEETLNEEEYVIWGIVPDAKDESLLLAEPNGKKITNKSHAEKFKKWCEDKGATECRIQKVDLVNPPDFTKGIR